MDMNELMAQAKTLQDKVAAAQAQLGKISVKGIAAGGLCIVDMSGKYDLLKLAIAPDLLKKDLAEVAEIISAAFRDAKEKADATIDDVMGRATAGMALPE